MAPRPSVRRVALPQPGWGNLGDGVSLRFGVTIEVMTTRTAAVLAAALTMTLSVRDARAEFEMWTPVEVRVPVVTATTPTWPRLDLRLVGEARFAARFNGSETLFLRVGPVLYCTP